MTQLDFNGNSAAVNDAKAFPRYRHDCDCCHFLGQHEGENGLADLYAHVAGHMPTVIARYSSDGPDYASGASFSYGRMPDLTEARLRAQRLGVWTYNVKEALFYVDSSHTPCVEELRSSLPFTEEYQAFLAYDAGDKDRYQGLVRHLVHLHHAKACRYEPKASQLASVMQVQNDISKVVSAYLNLDWRQAYEHPTLQSVTEFLFEELMLSASTH